MTSIVLTSVDDLAPRIQRTLDLLSAKLNSLQPDAAWHHIGSTAIPGALTKGDVDVLLRVSPERFQDIVTALRRHFTIKQASNWTSEFASFGDDSAYALPVGIQVVVEGSHLDFFLLLRDYLISNPDALRQYNLLKIAHADRGEQDYREAKDGFLGKILAGRKP
jgi:GrpB-like predicted nucleotidyltransferase (UPF0157 family)